MQPIIVFPMNDPAGATLPHLQKITPLLKRSFAYAYVSITAETRLAQPEYVAWLETDGFFNCLPIPPKAPVGEHFQTLFTWAAAACPHKQVLHLCFIDRLAYALQSEYRQAFIADMAGLTPAQTPMIFQRSAKAWASHPVNYRELENMVTRAGELLFGKSLDFAWCHLALTAAQLGLALQDVQNADISMMAEMITPLIERIQTCDVDWLAWEDPFILGEDPLALKAARQASPDETRKRLAYVIPMLQVLYKAQSRQTEQDSNQRIFV